MSKPELPPATFERAIDLADQINALLESEPDELIRETAMALAPIRSGFTRALQFELESQDLVDQGFAGIQRRSASLGRQASHS